MYRLIADGVELVLPEGYKPDFSLNFNELTKQNGSRVFPFTLPACVVNDLFFGYAHNPQSNISRTKKFSATLLNDSLFLAKGYLVLKMASVRGGYTCELLMPPALINLAIWDSNLRDLDFGTITLPTELKVEDCYTIAITDYMKAKFYPYFQTTYKVFVNSTIYAEYHAIQTVGLDRLTFENVYSGLCADFNSQAHIDAGWSMNYIDDTLIVIAPSNTSFVLTLGMYKGIEPRNGITQPYQEGFQFVRLEYQNCVSYNTLLNNTPANSMFCLPTIKAEKFYGDANVNFNGYINYGFAAFDRNTPTDPNKYALSPCLWLHNAIKKLSQILGYTATGDFMSDAAFANAYLMTMVSIDMQCPACEFPYNIWENVITLASHLPNMTVKAFLANISLEFGIDISFDVLGKTVSFSFIFPKINSSVTTDLSSKVSAKNLLIEHQDTKHIQLVFDGLTDIEETDSYFASVPTDADKVVGLTYEKTEYKFRPPKLYNLEDDVSIAYIRTRANGGGGVVVAPPARYVPSSNAEGVSNLFDKWKNTPSNYISFYVGTIAPAVSSMRHSANQLAGVSLQIVGSYGLAVKNEVITKHLEGTYTLTVDMPLTDAEIANLKSWRKYHLYGVNFFLNSCDGKAGENLKLKFRKV